VAHSLSAKKRVRQNAKRRMRNRAHKDGIREQTKSFLSALTKGDGKVAGVELNKTVELLDRAAAKHTIHKNTAARNRSRLTKRLNVLRAKGATAKA
jgi:small subunit ribosomal protein S20